MYNIPQPPFALLLIDLQNDYLITPNLQPAPAQIIASARELLTTCRRANIPILHILTTVTRNPDNRMPHWKIPTQNSPEGRWTCEAHTPGHETPLAPNPHEKIFHKQFFSAFQNPELHPWLQSQKITTLILAGIHLHACLRATALDAYERGYQVLIASEATGSDDPLHAAITRRYLEDRSIQFETNTALKNRLPQISNNPSNKTEPSVLTPRPPLSTLASGTFATQSSTLTNLATRYHNRPTTTLAHRAHQLRRFAKVLLNHEPELAHQITIDIGKPIRMATGEVKRSVELLTTCADIAESSQHLLESPADPQNPNKSARWRRLPLGLIAIITPWNNPLAIPIGKIAPALLYGNAVAWKPAPPAAPLAQKIAQLWQPFTGGLLELITGDHSAAAALADSPNIDALSLSGSLRAGYALHERCLRRHIPFQAELGGNNAAILADDAHFASALPKIAAGAFDFAGQRCTANRRLIIPKARMQEVLEALTAATRQLIWGDPFNTSTSIGPLIHSEKRDEILATLDRARDANLRVIIPHEHQLDYAHLLAKGPYAPPAIILCPHPSHELVQEEFFAPILVVQPADNFNHALELCNSVRQGLVAALFSNSPELQEKFLATAQAGVLKLNTPTADADAASPLGGWKASGIGPPEHGPADLEFFTRYQTIYQA